MLVSDDVLANRIVKETRLIMVLKQTNKNTSPRVLSLVVILTDKST